MIPHVTKGGHMYGLIRYLQGKGRVEEHVSPHVVGGDGFLQAWYGTEVLEAGSIPEITDYLEEPRRRFATTVKAQVKAQDPQTGEKVVMGYRDAHVWHCSLSLRAEEGALSDEQWQEISADFMDRMDFTDAGGKSSARWVAIHHGASKNGNDHIHIAASRVREDGTRWDARLDFKRAQDACRELEAKYGLDRVEGREHGLGEPASDKAERLVAQNAGREVTDRQELAHRIRSAAVASTSEAEWVRRCRADGVVLKPFFAKGTTDVVTGYRAALKPGSYNESLHFRKGSGLGKDLSLPRIREGWAEPSVEDASAAVAEWQAAFRGQAPVGGSGGREQVRFTGLAAGAQDVAASNWAAYNETLRQAPIQDRAAWGDAARDASGVLSAWARMDPAHAAELRAAAAALSRSAQVRRAPLAGGRRGKASPMGAALILMSATGKDRNKIQAALLMRQVIKTAQALADMHRAAGAVRQAELLQRQVVERLQAVQLVGYKATMPEGLSAEEQTRWHNHQVATTFSRAAGGPLPNKLADPKASEQSQGVSPRGGAVKKGIDDERSR